MKLSILLLIAVLSSGCSLTVVYAPKNPCIHGNGNEVRIEGSDLKDNKAQQSWDSLLTIPWLSDGTRNRRTNDGKAKEKDKSTRPFANYAIDHTRGGEQPVKV